MKTNAPSELVHGSTSCSFVAKHSNEITGFLEGFDRLRIRGTLRQLYCPTVMEAFLCAHRVRFSQFKEFVSDTSRRLIDAAEALAARLSRPLVYITSGNTRKEEVAREIARRDHVEQGLIAVLKAVEPCQTYSLRRKREGHGFEFRLEVRKCLHFYFYFEHPVFGFMNLRLQSWVPFRVDLCLNGRHWLARQLEAEAIAYRKRENAIVWVADPKRAQALLEAQLKTDWRHHLGALLEETHPTHRAICAPLKMEYYWSISESEYASDVLFRSAEPLARIYPGLVGHAVQSFGAGDVMRFLGRKVPTQTGRVSSLFKGEVISDLKHRPEGIRVKHHVNANSIKVYDKHGTVLRVETTINNPAEFKVYRTAESKAEKGKQWRVLRRNVSDIRRRAKISQAANRRYLEALAAVSGTVPLQEYSKPICHPVRNRGRRYRALNPLSAEDGALLEALNRGEFTINGFRNRDLRRLLYSRPKNAPLARKQARAMTRRLALLRAHHLIAKIPHTHRYIVTSRGRRTVTAILGARRADIDQLTSLAA